MDSIRQWALCLIFSAAAGTLVTVISPRGSMEKTLRAVVGIFIVAAICTPLTKLSADGLTLSAFAPAEDSAENEKLNEFILDGYKTASEKTILQVAEKRGIHVENIAAEMDINSDGCIIIHNIIAVIKEIPQKEKEEFARELSYALGAEVEVRNGS